MSAAIRLVDALVPHDSDPDDWQTLAACRGANPDVFFPGRGDHEAVTAAKRICAGCEVRVECLESVLHEPSVVGIFGGTSDRERSRMRGALKGRWPKIADMVLDLLGTVDEPLTSRDIATRLGTHLKATRSALRYLITDGLVVSFPDPGDGNRYLFQLCGGEPNT